MGLLDSFLKSKGAATALAVPEDQAVLVYIEGEDLDASIPIQMNLISLLENDSVGMFDGNEVGGDQIVLFLYGPDAELLFTRIEPVLRADEFCIGARVVIRWGGPDAPKREVKI